MSNTYTITRTGYSRGLRDTNYIWAEVDIGFDIRPFQDLVTVTEYEMAEVGRWCAQHDCGVRMAFNQFRFRDDAEYSMFLLRWSS